MLLFGEIDAVLAVALRLLHHAEGRAVEIDRLRQVRDLRARERIGAVTVVLLPLREDGIDRRLDLRLNLARRGDRGEDLLRVGNLSLSGPIVRGSGGENGEDGEGGGDLAETGVSHAEYRLDSNHYEEN